MKSLLQTIWRWRTAIALLIGLGIWTSCSAAPPYVPPPVVNFTSLGWNLTDTNDAVNVHSYPPGASSWDLLATVPAGQTTAAGVLTNRPSGTAYVVTFTNTTTGAESLPSNQVTNNIVPVLSAPSGLTGH